MNPTATRRSCRAAARSVALAALILLATHTAFALDPSLDVSQYAHTSWKTRDGFVPGTTRRNFDGRDVETLMDSEKRRCLDLRSRCCWMARRLLPMQVLHIAQILNGGPR